MGLITFGGTAASRSMRWACAPWIVGRKARRRTAPALVKETRIGFTVSVAIDPSCEGVSVVRPCKDVSCILVGPFGFRGCKQSLNLLSVIACMYMHIKTQ